jgi:hypothetical protein
VANLLANGTAWLARVHASHASETRVYTRLDGTSKSLPLTAGETEADGPADASLVVTIRTTDFLVALEDWETAFGIGARPDVGDTIAIGDTIRRVSKLGDAPHWRFTDGHQNRLRIHTSLNSE